MRHRPAPVSEAGERACHIAEELARGWAPDAGARDRSGRFDPALVAGVQRSGLAGCCVPVELDGWGVEQLRDVMAVVHRLAAGDASMALVVHMHVSACWSLARTSRHEDARTERELLADVAQGRAWLSAAVTEAGTNFFHPRATLRRQGERWHLSGTKVFATGSPAATHLSTNARRVAGDGDDRLARVIVAADLPGVRVEDDWDGLGMRASGSGTVHFDDVELPAGTAIGVGGRFGEMGAAALCGRAFGNVGNITAMAGIAAAAEELAVRHVSTTERVDRSLATRPTVRQALGQLHADAAALAAVIDWLGRRADEVATAASGAPVSGATARELMADFQAAKVNVNRLAPAVVDQALALVGGGGYRAAGALARHTRDVRAGQFMQPFSPHEALGFIGAVSTGIDPDVEA